MPTHHIVIDARIRQASTGRPVDRLLEYLQQIDTTNKYTVLLRSGDKWQPTNSNFVVLECKYPIFSFNPLQQITYAWFLHNLKPSLVYFTMTGQQPIGYFGNQITLTHDLTMFKYVRAGKLLGILHSLRMLAYRLLVWQSHKKAKHIITPSLYVKKAVVRKYRFVKQKVSCIYEASEPPIKDHPKRPPGVKKPFILHIGSPFPHKNIDRLIESFATIKTKHPDLNLVLAGKREYHFDQLIKSYKDSPIAKSISTPGFVSDGELKWLYQNAECYVLPSLSEGFGLPGLEAMAHNCPLVSSNATCLPEVYGNGAYYFDPVNIQDMADKVNSVLKDHHLQTKLIKAGQKQLKKYSWQKMTKETYAVFRQVLEKS